MLRLYVGEDRVAAEKAVKRALGASYEVFEGENLTPEDLPNVFLGTSLFGGLSGADGVGRRILLKGLTENGAVWEKVADYAGKVAATDEVVIWEAKADKRSATYKALVAAGAEVREFALAKRPEERLVFQVYDTALRDGVAAVKMVERIEVTQDPYMFFGLLVTQALKKLETRPLGQRERRNVQLLGRADMMMKRSQVEPWQAVKVALREIGG